MTNPASVSTPLSRPEIQIEGLDQEDVGSILHVRSLSQFRAMIDGIRSGKCMFCQLDPQLNVIIKSVDAWRMWANPFPLKHTANHYIIAPDRHITHVNQMSSKDWDAFGALVDYATNAEVGFNMNGGAVAMRFGDPRLNAGTVRHLHANIIQPDGSGRVQVTLAKEPHEIEEAMRRVIIFNKIVEGTKFDDLQEWEKDAVRDRLN